MIAFPSHLATLSAQGVLLWCCGFTTTLTVYGGQGWVTVADAFGPGDDDGDGRLFGYARSRGIRFGLDVSGYIYTLDDENMDLEP